MDAEALLARVCAVLGAQIPTLRGAPLAPDTPLVSSGLLDSFGVVTLVAALEEAFAFEIDVERLEVDQFETPATIADLCGATPNGS